MKEQDAIKLLKEKGYSIIKGNDKWLEIPELKLKVEIDVHDKNKSWNALRLSERENELLTLQECIFLANHPKYSKILKMDGSTSNDDFFIQQPFQLNKKKNFVAGFSAGSVRAFLDCNGYPSNSNSSLGLRFVVRKKLK